MTEPADPMDSESRGNPKASTSWRLRPLLRLLSEPARDATTVRWLFLRLLAICYVIAFFSLGLQITGLLGEHGILPATEMMRSLGEHSVGLGIKKFFLLPTFCWYRADDDFLRLQCWPGVALALLALGGVAQKLSFFLLWAFYLSLSTVGEVFLGYQWDALLLEMGLLGLLFAPASLHPVRAAAHPVSKGSLWLIRWLLFRLMISSGAVKLLSGDPTWRDLSALNYHYQTQPLPTWIGWYAHHLPGWWHKASVIAMYAIELGVPALIIAPRRFRLSACACLIVLQLVIAATGNYGFFNLLTAVASLSLLDDQFMREHTPRRWRSVLFRWMGLEPRPLENGNESSGARAFRIMARSSAGLVLIVVGIVSSMVFLAPFGHPRSWPRPLVALYSVAAPFRSINNYGLFAVMTTNRPEIIVEGSLDGQTWLPYEFKWKPGELKRRPSFVEPHQPRLDWQMWFAALGDYRENPWFMNFCCRLLQGAPDVLALLEKNPFPKQPPLFVRATLYEYQFTTMEERSRTGNWWKREYKGRYCPTLSLKERGKQTPALTPFLEQ